MEAMNRRSMALVALLVLVLLSSCAGRSGSSSSPAGPSTRATVTPPDPRIVPRKDYQTAQSMMRFLGVQSGDVVAELAAATGDMTYWLAAFTEDAGKVYAVEDTAEGLAEVAGRENMPTYGRVELVLAAPDDPKLPEGEIDLVLSVNSWHQIPDRVDYIARLGSSLSHRGRVAIVDWHKADLPAGPPVKSRVSRDLVVSEFDQAGFDLAAESVVLEFRYFLIFVPREAS